MGAFVLILTVIDFAINMQLIFIIDENLNTKSENKYKINKFLAILFFPFIEGELIASPDNSELPKEGRYIKIKDVKYIRKAVFWLQIANYIVNITTTIFFWFSFENANISVFYGKIISGVIFVIFFVFLVILCFIVIILAQSKKDKKQ